MEVLGQFAVDGIPFHLQACELYLLKNGDEFQAMSKTPAGYLQSHIVVDRYLYRRITWELSDINSGDRAELEAWLDLLDAMKVVEEL